MESVLCAEAFAPSLCWACLSLEDVFRTKLAVLRLRPSSMQNNAYPLGAPLYDMGVRLGGGVVPEAKPEEVIVSGTSRLALRGG